MPVTNPVMVFEVTLPTLILFVRVRLDVPKCSTYPARLDSLLASHASVTLWPAETGPAAIKNLNKIEKSPTQPAVFRPDLTIRFIVPNYAFTAARLMPQCHNWNCCTSLFGSICD